MKCIFCGADVRVNEKCEYCGSFAEPSYYYLPSPSESLIQQKYNETANLIDGEITDFCINYIVKSGDTLWNIAKEFYGNGIFYRAIAKENKLKIPHSVCPGDILKIPYVKKE